MIKRDIQLRELEDLVHRLRTEHAPASQIKAAQNRTRAYRANITRKSLQKYKIDWVQKRKNWKIMTRGREQSENDERTDYLEICPQLMPDGVALRGL